jgi:hypothetical protein
MCKINILHKIEVFISDYWIIFFYKLNSYLKITDLEKIMFFDNFLIQNSKNLTSVMKRGSPLKTDELTLPSLQSHNTQS